MSIYSVPHLNPYSASVTVEDQPIISGVLTVILCLVYHVTHGVYHFFHIYISRKEVIG